MKPSRGEQDRYPLVVRPSLLLAAGIGNRLPIEKSQFANLRDA